MKLLHTYVISRKNLHSSKYQQYKRLNISVTSHKKKSTGFADFRYNRICISNQLSQKISYLECIYKKPIPNNGFHTIGKILDLPMTFCTCNKNKHLNNKSNQKKIRQWIQRTNRHLKKEEGTVRWNFGLSNKMPFLGRGRKG